MKNKNKSTYWEKEILPKIKNIYDSISTNLVSKQITESFAERANEVDKANKNYKKNHNRFLYFLICFSFVFSVILLFIPFYWNFKKYKEMKKNKGELKQKIELTKAQKLKLHSEIVGSLNYNEIMNNFSKIIPYRHLGPIPAKLIELMQESSIFNLEQSVINNTYDSSWGIFDNKIIINAANQEHTRYMETYTGSETISVPYTKSDGTTGYHSETVYATYSHPAYRIANSKKMYCFMESCSNLEFHLERQSNKFSSKRFNKNNGFSPLENNMFEKTFNWSRNDDVQFRMIFSPYCQESFVNEYEANGKIANELKWAKHKSFITNGTFYKSKSLLPEDWLIEGACKFISKSELSLIDFDNIIFKAITNYYENIYKSLNFMYLTTIMNSEDHTNIIKYALNSDQVINSSNISYLIHYALNEALKKKILIRDTDCFSEIKGIENKYIANNNLYLANLIGTSYDKITKYIYIPTHSSIGMVDVEVQYYEYIPHHKNAIVGAIYLNSNDYFYNTETYGVKTNIYDEQLRQEFINLNELVKCSLRNNILSFFVPEESTNNLGKVYVYIDRIINILNNSNINNNTNV